MNGCSAPSSQWRHSSKTTLMDNSTWSLILYLCSRQFIWGESTEMDKIILRWAHGPPSVQNLKLTHPPQTEAEDLALWIGAEIKHFLSSWKPVLVREDHRNLEVGKVKAGKGGAFAKKVSYNFPVELCKTQKSLHLLSWSWSWRFSEPRISGWMHSNFSLSHNEAKKRDYRNIKLTLLFFHIELVLKESLENLVNMFGVKVLIRGK